MMRNVAIGAVLGFGLVVVLLSVFNTSPPPPAPPPVAVAAPVMVALDAGPAPNLEVNTAPVVLKAPVIDNPVIDNQRRHELMRQILNERRNGLHPANVPVSLVFDAGQP